MKHFLIQTLLYLLIISTAQGELSLTYQLLHSDGNYVAGRPWWKNTPPRGSYFHSLCGNSAQFKEALSLRSPIVLNGSQPKAVLLFPFCQPQLYQTWCGLIAWPAPGSTSRNSSPTSSALLSLNACFSSSSVKGSQGIFWHLTCSVDLRIRAFVFWRHILFPCYLTWENSSKHWKQCREGWGLLPVILCACWNLHVICFILEFASRCNLTQDFALWFISHKFASC